MSHPTSRRTVAKGAAWSAPVVMLTAAAPAMAASQGVLDVRFYNETGCVGTSGCGDVYMNVNVQNNTTTPVTLASSLVFTVALNRKDRNHVAPTTSYGTITCNTAETLTSCDSFTWTIPTGTVIQPGAEVDFVIHALADCGFPAQLTTSTTSPLVTNKSSGTDTQGYTGPSGCVSYGPF